MGLQRQRHRAASLDILRSIAVLLVIIYHMPQIYPGNFPWLRVTFYGQYGVDLFFILSGWLIGGLYWREVKNFGQVNVIAFWQRRWLRTIPPYLVALCLSWLAVWMSRREPFDLAY